MCNAHRGERPGAQIARRGAGYSSRRWYQGLLRRDAWCLAISWPGGGAQCTTYDMGLLLVCREISMARWCDSRYGMILYVSVLDDGHGSSSGYGTVSVSRCVAVAQGRVKERRDAARAVQGCHYWLEARREGQWFSSSARAARQKSSGSGMGIRLRPTGLD
jgi:hypothetical protein